MSDDEQPKILAPASKGEALDTALVVLVVAGVVAVVVAGVVVVVVGLVYGVSWAWHSGARP